jgi:large subunit ribosomal protein L25
MEPRAEGGKGASRRLRKTGFIPCVFYGPEWPSPISGKVNTTKLARLLSAGHWETMRLTLKLPSGSEEMCIIREVQRHPLTGKLVHIDFMRLLKGRKVTVNVPVRVHGKDVCPGIREGGVLENLHEIEVETLPMNIPEFIDVDISNLALGETLHVKDLKLGGDIALLADPEEVVAIVATPKAVDETAASEEKEVEVVAKGKAAKGEE